MCLDFVALKIHLTAVDTGAATTPGLVEFLEGTARLPFQDEARCVTGKDNTSALVKQPTDIMN